MRTTAALLASVIILSSYTGHAQVVREPSKRPAEWSRSYPAFRIAGNLFYVGTADLACYLLTTTEGHILINTGLASSAVQIRRSIESLGFRYRDIRILLTTQAHYDHVGAIETIRRKTGAKVVVNEAELLVVKDGGRSDYELGGEYASYKPVSAATAIKDGDSVRLGGTSLLMLAHPGHTKGSASYLVDVQDSARTYRVLIANIPTIISDRKFSEITAYPGIAEDYAATIRKMQSLRFDLWVASHASQFSLSEKHRPGQPYNPMAFADRKGYDETMKEQQLELEKKLATETKR